MVDHEVNNPGLDRWQHGRTAVITGARREDARQQAHPGVDVQHGGLVREPPVSGELRSE